MGWLRYAVGTRSLWWRHPPDAVDQHRSPLHLDGCCRVAHLLRCSGSPSQRNPHRPYRWSRGNEVRRLAAAERGVRQAVRYRNAQLAAQRPETLKRNPKARRYPMSTATSRTVSPPRRTLWAGWLLFLGVVPQLRSSAWFRATHHTYAVAEIVTGYGYPESAI